MSLLRILVDGDRLLEDWAKLAPGKPRHSTAAREELINHLLQYLRFLREPNHCRLLRCCVRT